MKIPYGIHDFKTIKTENYLFIDKTSHIAELEKLGKYVVFLRPRRFGKSLFTSMLYYYYDINSTNIFDNIFKDTYIRTNKTQEASSYYILKFDFSGISTEKDAIDNSFLNKVKTCIKIFIDYYKLNIKMDNRIKKSNEYLECFLSEFKAQTNKQIYLLIDEYDHFANNVLTTDLTLFNEITGKDGFVRSFYEVFKTYAGTVIGRMFITGVTPITLDSLTSGFNMSKNLTKFKSLNDMMGFTEGEVIHTLNKLKISNEHLITLKDNYNGYLFNKNSNNKVYNSNMVLYYLDSLVLTDHAPENLTDPNIISDYTKITSMFDLYNNPDDKKSLIHKILTDEVITSTVIDKFNLKLEFGRDEFLSLLYYLGLLTLDSGYGSETELKTPNNITKNVYFEYYYHYLNKELDINLDARNIKDAVLELSKDNNISPFITLIEKFLREIDNRDFIKFDEKYIKLLMMTYVNLANLYLVKSEYPVGGCYIDLALLPNGIYELNNYFIFEIKYISKSNYTKKLFNEKRTEAIEQIGRYAAFEEMKNIKNLKKYIIIFVHDECRLVEEI